VVLPFLIGNPLQETAEFQMFAQPATAEQFEALATAVGGQPVFAEARLTLGESDDARGEDVLRLTLQPGEQRRLYVGIELANRIDKGQFATFEVSQRREDGETLMGGLGFVIGG
jgi:hypothetical protein